MKLKLKEGLSDTIIYNPFENRNVLGKFIDEGLYPHLYKRAPELFDIVTEVKKTTKDDISINNTKHGSSSNTQGKIS